ncbi:ribonuclease HII [Sandaracinobacteroides saxicola]|uniref:ribonuclease HII n=1 Tax=Sandaracinobacteroides saxicola TaxID=2759707 RepID=UPI001FB0A877|nr:ribonuclease HII [Sandaracinobacteroides saxicola]
MDLSLLRVAGVDEAGRGAWCGPVVAGAVVFWGGVPEGVGDSKALSAARRETLVPLIRAVAHVGVGVALVEEIEALNIQGATFLAMRRAVAALPVRPALVRVDGNRAPDFGVPAETMVGGDARCPAIGAASIVAKVARDAMMRALDADFPGYGFARHKGYGTAEHAAALARLGVCTLHRRGFAPVAKLLGG